jgi:hypothetical protein
LSIAKIIKYVNHLETLNETFHFRFDKQAEALANQALYITVKKAFTPYAALHTLK